MRIINAAMDEFAQKGYSNASTNMMVKEAGISKGILFHYFKNKKELFLYLYDFAADLLIKDYYGRLDNASRDIFIRLKQISSYKMEIIAKYPQIYNFIMLAYFEDSGEVKPDIQKRTDQMVLGGYGRVYENIDFSLFKENIDVNKAIEIISWSIEGLAMREQQKLKYSKDIPLDFEKILAEMDVYLDILKQCFYKHW